MTDAQQGNSRDPLASIWDQQPYADGPEFTEWFSRLTKPQQVLFPTHWLCVEVYNGGFHQYFTNSTGHHAPEAILGFRELGLNDIADIVQSAIAVFGEVFPRKRAEREGFLAAFDDGGERPQWDPFYGLDDAFYEAIKILGAREFNEDDRFTCAAKNYVSKVS